MNAIKTHSALVRTIKGLQLIQVETPQSKEFVELEPQIVGVCGTDLQILTGERSDPALVLGHEGSVLIVGNINNINYTLGIDPGNKIYINPTNNSDGLLQLGHNINGLWQERLFLPVSVVQKELVGDVPECIQEPLSALIEPLATVLYSLDLMAAKSPINSLAIFGSGTIGLLQAIQAKCNGISRIFVSHGSAQSLQWAVQHGFSESEEPNNISVTYSDDKKHENFDAVVVCTPRSASLACLKKAVDLVCSNGCIDLFGGFTDGDSIAEIPLTDLNQVRRSNNAGRIDNARFFDVITNSGKHVRLTGHRGASKKYFSKAIELLSNSPELYMPLVTHTVSMASAAEILNNYIHYGRRDIDGTRWVKLAIDTRIKGKSIFSNSKKA